MNHASLAPEVPDVLAAWGIRGRAALSPITSGTLNWNFRVAVGTETYFLRCYRPDLETPRIEGEHALLAWVGERDIPAPGPIRTLAGATLLNHKGQRWALFPWFEGEPVQRGSMTSSQVRAMGKMHGRVQRALAEHPESQRAPFGMRWDKGESLKLLDRVIENAERQGAESWVLVGIREQRALLAALDVRRPEEFASLPQQMLHGDFHDQQLLFAEHQVTAVTDWEIWHTDPRAWEVVRSLAFSRLLESPLLADYGAGFREHIQLGETECRLALELWWQSRIVGVWVWAAHFLGGNQRLADFFPETIADLRKASSASWRADVAERVVASFCG